MTPAERHEKARELREEGWTYKQIGAAVDRHGYTVCLWLNPGVAERNRERKRSPEYRERHRATCRAYSLAHGKPKGVCELCGGFTSEREHKRCANCVTTGRGFRRLQIQSLWHMGMTLRDMADTLKSTRNAVGTEMFRMRREGWDLPYRKGYPR